MKAVLEAEHLTRRFGRTEAVVDLTLEVPEGAMFALVGPNGAGKTTTIQVMMNLLAPTSGCSRVLGVDSRRLRARQLEQIGYVSENQEMYDWMTVGALADFCRSLYPTWDPALAASLARSLDLPLDRPLRAMSRGMRMKAALLSSLAYRPRLLVMDEPFAGLDALIREELVGGLLEVGEREGWTLFVSSHDIDEIERLVDWVGFIDHGRLVLAEPVASLLGRFRRVAVTLPEPGALPQTGLPAGCLLPEANAHVVSFVDSQWTDGVSDRRTCDLWPSATLVEATPMSLRDIFVTLARTWRGTSVPHGATT